MNDLLTRRRFISALAASVVAVGAPLPIGFPKEAFSDLKWTASGVSLDQWRMFEELEYAVQYVTGINSAPFKLFTSKHKYND